MIRICKEESFHQRQGYEIMITLCNGSDEQKELAQDALNRFWWPSLMMFGPPEGDSVHSNQSMIWKIKRFSNDDLREKFINATVPQAEHLGLTIPDPELKWNEEKQGYDHGDIDWNEFWRVVKGDGICNRDRLKKRRKVHRDGAWVREAALAFASKRADRQSGNAQIAAE